MTATRNTLLIVFASIFALTSLRVPAQVVVATIPVGRQPYFAEVNPATNKTYVVNGCGSDPACQSAGTVSVIDGATLSTQTVGVGYQPFGVAVNSVTSKIYVVNTVCIQLPCSSNGNGSVTVIDGATLSTRVIGLGFLPYLAEVNSVTNKIYVTNYCGSDPACQSAGTVTVIDGVTLSTLTVTVGYHPGGLAVNSVTNKIYVVNECGNDPNCESDGTVTVIDGATLSTQTVTAGFFASRPAVNSVTNKIYVANACATYPGCESGTVTVIDGATLSTQTVMVGIEPSAAAIDPVVDKVYVVNDCGNDPSCRSNGTVSVIDAASDSVVKTVNVGLQPNAVRVDVPTNKIYVPNYASNTVTMIDGNSYSNPTVNVGSIPTSVPVNPVTNRIYVTNRCGDDPTCQGNGTVSVIAGGANSTPLQFVAMTPCRLVDTRPQDGGSGPISGRTARTFNLPQLAQAQGCRDLSLAAAYSLNITVVPSGSLGYLTLWPTGEDQPVVSTLNSPDGRVKANAAITPAGYQGEVSVYVTDTTNVVIDVDGYFAPAAPSTLAFYPLTPCRVADTRKSTFPHGLGTPHLTGKTARDFPVLSATSCGIPDTAQAYSLNLTAIPYPRPGSLLGYLEVWPRDQMPQNPVSTLNNPTGTIVANAAIVPAGTGGDITAYPSNDTDLVIDINGYFAPAGPGGMSLYPAAPCRALDTRKIGHGQPFSGTLTPPMDVTASVCGPPSSAQAYVFNATVVPVGPLGYLSLWPDGETQPVVSTLNAVDGAITNNMAIVPTNNGKIDAYAGNGLTQLLLDISSYFAP
jgi:YVTN family beta-propeller protein